MATTQHLRDAAALAELSTFNYDDWSSQDVQLLDKWLFKDGKWDHSQGWIDYSRPDKYKYIMHMAASLASLLAKENNKP